MIGSRVAVAVFTFEAFNVCVFELRAVFSLFLSHEIGRRICTIFLGSFIEALGVCVSGRGPSTDTPSPFALLVLWNSFGFRSSLTDGLDSLLIRPILGRSGR